MTSILLLTKTVWRPKDLPVCKLRRLSSKNNWKSKTKLHNLVCKKMHIIKKLISGILWYKSKVNLVWWSYCPSRVNICHTENLFKCILRGFAYNRGPWKHYIRIRPLNVLIKIKNPCGTWFTAIFIGGIQGLKAYNFFKAILQSKPLKRSTSVGLVWVCKNLEKKNVTPILFWRDIYESSPI